MQRCDKPDKSCVVLGSSGEQQLLPKLLRNLKR